MTFNIARQLNYFMAATTAEGLHYVDTSKDVALFQYMYNSRQNWVADEMKIFHQLAKKFYDIDDSEGYFLDLGAHIGTTGIYFTKILAPNLKLLAFEPDKENFKLLRANLILNDLENSVAENYGLGDVESEMTSYHIDTNTGGSGIFANLYPGQENSPSETIEIITLDRYFAQNKLNPKDVKYIWIDAEGFEAQVILGAKNILLKNPAPIFMEFNPFIWQKFGYYEKFMRLLTKLYKGYIWIPELQRTGEIQVHSIEKLWEFQNSTDWIGSLGDIFLIHKL